MTIQEALSKINRLRGKQSLYPIHIMTRPSVSCPTKETILIMCREETLHKSTHWGAISPFLKGMLTAFSEKTVKIEMPITKQRKIEWR